MSSTALLPCYFGSFFSLPVCHSPKHWNLHKNEIPINLHDNSGPIGLQCILCEINYTHIVWIVNWQPFLRRQSMKGLRSATAHWVYWSCFFLHLIQQTLISFRCNIWNLSVTKKKLLTWLKWIFFTNRWFQVSFLSHEMKKSSHRTRIFSDEKKDLSHTLHNNSNINKWSFIVDTEMENNKQKDHKRRREWYFELRKICISTKTTREERREGLQTIDEWKRRRGWGEIGIS